MTVYYYSKVNTLAADVFNARLADFDAKLSSVNRKITANKTKHLLVETELKKLKIFIQFISEVKGTLKKMAHKII